MVGADQPRLSDRDRGRERKIEQVLRPHWKAAVVDQEEIDISDSFDEALTELQLLELAVETGCLSMDAAAVPARKYLLELLWSKGARKFVRAYDYVTVQWLAERFSVRIGGPAWEALHVCCRRDPPKLIARRPKTFGTENSGCTPNCLCPDLCPDLRCVFPAGR